MRCLKCGYILDGLPENRCPECGRPFNPTDDRTYRVGNARPLSTPATVRLFIACGLGWICACSGLVLLMPLEAAPINRSRFHSLHLLCSAFVVLAGAIGDRALAICLGRIRAGLRGGRRFFIITIASILLLPLVLLGLLCLLGMLNDIVYIFS